MRALVTGAAGFVGANLSGHLLREGHEVHVVQHPDGDCWRIAEMGESIAHRADLLLPGTAHALVAEIDPDWIFHLAAYGAYSWQTDAMRICATNLSATIELADAAECHGVSAFVHAGSSSEYGFKDHAPSEDERLEPNSAYAVAKAAATMYCRHRAREGRLPAVTLRLYSVYGALEDERRLVSTLLREGRQRRFPPLVSPETARDFVYAEDVCIAFVRAAAQASEVAGEIYNVGSGRQTTLRELVERVRELLGIPEQPHWDTYPARAWDSDCWSANVERISSDLGWLAATGLDDGLDLMRRLTEARLARCSYGPEGRVTGR